MLKRDSSGSRRLLKRLFEHLSLFNNSNNSGAKKNKLRSNSFETSVVAISFKIPSSVAILSSETNFLSLSLD